MIDRLTPTHQVRLSGDLQMLLLRQEAQAIAGKAPHTHPEGQFYFAMDGLTAIDTSAGRIALPPGRAGWIPPGVEHGARVIGGSKQIAPGRHVGFTMYLAPSRCTSLAREPLVLGVSDVVAAMLRRMATWPQGQPLSGSQQRFLQVFLDELAQATPEPLRLTMPADVRLERIATAILDDPSDEASIDEWASRIAMSRRTITRRFRAETGLSVVEWRQMARLQRALELLNEGKSVTNVSLTMGYDSVSSFIALFKRFLGVTPGQFSGSVADPI